MIFDFDNGGATIRGFLTSGLTACDDTAFYGGVNLVEGHVARAGLLKHQVDSVAFLISRSGGILADDMGLGKTCSAIVSSLIGEDRLPALIICPAGLRNTWRDEVTRVAPQLTVALPNRPDDIPDGRFPDVVVIPFSRLKNFFGWEALPGFKVLFVDEAQAFKNSRAFSRRERVGAEAAVEQGAKLTGHRTAILFEIASQIPAVFCLTGTPILSRPRELFNLLRLIRHPLGKDFRRFSIRYCDGHQGAFGWQADGCTNAIELRESLRNVILRRMKDDVLNLPGKESLLTRTPLMGDWVNRYRNTWRDYIASAKLVKSKEAMRSAWKAKHLVSINLLRQICSLSKIEYLSDRLAGSTEKVIVFTSFSESLNGVCEKLEAVGIGHVRYEGGMNEKQRHAAVTAFRTDEQCRVFVSNTEAGKTGLTLVEATRVIFMDMVWTPADHYQAEDRAHRIGQTKRVTCEYLIVPDTVEDVIFELLATKKKVIDRILGASGVDNNGELNSNIEADFLSKIKVLAKQSLAGQGELF